MYTTEKRLLYLVNCELRWYLYFEKYNEKTNRHTCVPTFHYRYVGRVSKKKKVHRLFLVWYRILVCGGKAGCVWCGVVAESVVEKKRFCF